MKWNQSQKRKQTFDELIHGVDNGPQVAAFLAFFQDITKDTRTTFVAWGVPRKGDAVMKCADHLWRGWGARKSCSMETIVCSFQLVFFCITALMRNTALETAGVI